MMRESISLYQLDTLRSQIGGDMSKTRLEHTLGVEQTAALMADIYCPEIKNELCAAALLHDITKELSTKDHLEILQRYKAERIEELLASPATLHAVTATLIIPRKYPEYAIDEIIGAVRYHTTGRADMTLGEKIIYLADYIEPTRKYEGCKRLRREFFAADFDKMTREQKLLHLDSVILQSLDITLAHLVDMGGVICSDTLEAKQYIENQLGNQKNGEN